jgi:hypothetical protein
MFIFEICWIQIESENCFWLIWCWIAFFVECKHLSNLTSFQKKLLLKDYLCNCCALWQTWLCCSKLFWLVWHLLMFAVLFFLVLFHSDGCKRCRFWVEIWFFEFWDLNVFSVPIYISIWFILSEVCSHMLFVGLSRLYDLVLNQVIAILFYTYLIVHLFLNFLSLKFLNFNKTCYCRALCVCVLFELGYFWMFK